jgi:hypothetical protein
MEQTQKPKGKSMRELHRIVAEDTERWNQLGEAWPSLTTPEQEALVKWAQDKAKLRP